jgi:hypothetical protein
VALLFIPRLNYALHGNLIKGGAPHEAGKYGFTKFILKRDSLIVVLTLQNNELTKTIKGITFSTT